MVHRPRADWPQPPGYLASRPSEHCAADRRPRPPGLTLPYQASRIARRRRHCCPTGAGSAPVRYSRLPRRRPSGRPCGRCLSKCEKSVAAWSEDPGCTVRCGRPAKWRARQRALPPLRSKRFPAVPHRFLRRSPAPPRRQPPAPPQPPVARRPPELSPASRLRRKIRVRRAARWPPWRVR